MDPCRPRASMKRRPASASWKWWKPAPRRKELRLPTEALFLTAPGIPMAISVVMPALEMAQETGKLLAWRKKEGDRVVKGEPLLEIETDKAVVEVEAPGDGILAGITAQA